MHKYVDTIGLPDQLFTKVRKIFELICSRIKGSPEIKLHMNISIFTISWLIYRTCINIWIQVHKVGLPDYLDRNRKILKIIFLNFTNEGFSRNVTARKGKSSHILYYSIGMCLVEKHIQSHGMMNCT